MGGSVRMLHREELFRAGDSDWRVAVIWVRLPRDDRARQTYSVRRGSFVVIQTRDVARVRAAMGDDLFAALTEVDA